MNKGIRELTIDELDIVSGGEGQCVTTSTAVSQVYSGKEGMLHLTSTPMFCGGIVVNIPGATWSPGAPK